MKTYLLIALSLLTATGAIAQSPVSDANRIILTSTSGDRSAYMIDRVQDITFARVEGEVAADINLIAYDYDSLTLSITRTAACQGFKIAVLPTLMLNRVTNDEQAIAYINYYGSEVYYEDFTEGVMTGVSFDSDTDYTVMTYGTDIYGVACEVRRVDFHTDRIAVTGAPYVDMKIDEVGQNYFTITFTPNDDVSSYYFVAGEAGTMQQQYEMFAPMFGYANFGQMVMAWGVEHSGTYTYTYKNMSPNTDYEIFVQALDVNGNMADVIVYEASTSGLGGDGEALVDITIGDYVLNEWPDGNGNDVLLPSQFITFTPNENCSRYHFGVYLAKTYDATPDEIDEFICSEPEQPMAYWWFYDPLTTDYQINPSVDYIVLAAGQNIDREWGKINKLRATTPEECQGSKMAGKGKISERIIAKKIKENAFSLGRIPYVKSSTLTIKSK